MSDSVVKVRTMGNTIEVVGTETEGLSIKGGKRKEPPEAGNS